MTIFPDDDVVVNGDAERGGDVDDGFRHRDIRLRRCRIAGRVIVHEETMRAIVLVSLKFLLCSEEQGTVTGDGNKFLFVMILFGHAPSRKLIFRHG